MEKNELKFCPKGGCNKYAIEVERKRGNIKENKWVCQEHGTVKGWEFKNIIKRRRRKRRRL